MRECSCVRECSEYSARVQLRAKVQRCGREGSCVRESGDVRGSFERATETASCRELRIVGSHHQWSVSLMGMSARQPHLLRRTPTCLLYSNSRQGGRQMVTVCTVSRSSPTHLTPPPASIAAGTRHESRSQACGARVVNAHTQRPANACKVSGRAVTFFNFAFFPRGFRIPYHHQL